jgi:hypothetical protein
LLSPTPAPASKLRAAEPVPVQKPVGGKSGEKVKESDARKDAKGEEKKDPLDDFDEVTKETTKSEGLFTFYRKAEKLYLELKPEQLDRDYLLTITQESGIGWRGIYNGMPLQDYLCRFRRVDDRLLFVQRNPWFRARPGQPVNRSLERAFTDSVLASMKLESVHKERKSLLVDVAPLFMTDLPGLGPMLKSVLGAPYRLDTAKSYYGALKLFPQNAELQTYCAFHADEPKWIEPLPDSRSLTLRLHYSLSSLPETTYRPRLADDRVGYFLTAFQDFGSDETFTPFVRYINRWHLEKKDASAALSEPKKPIVFWLENTIPLEYRDAIGAGILRWNLAFEKAGFKNAIVVKQQPDDAEWDAADVRYNTVRWIHSVDSAFAMGPSRVHPLTGEILDADIVVDANFVRYVKHDYRTLADPPTARAADLPNSLGSALPGDSSVFVPGWLAPPGVGPASALPWKGKSAHLCMAGPFMVRQARFGATALALRDGAMTNGAVPKEFLDAFWADLMAHEVGHTIGLRHNFHASTLLPLNQVHNRAVTAEKGLYGSVMDYNAVNIAISKGEQGDYYSPRVGPYDVWAIEYGYTPIAAATPEEELPTLRAIAERGTAHDLAYATDEDLWENDGPTSIDPLVMAGDLSDDPIAFARQRMSLANSLLKRLEARGPGQGNSYEEFRRDFQWIMGEYFWSGFTLRRWIGGQYFRRNHAGDRGERPPLEPVPVARQREALAIMRQSLLAENAFRFAPQTLNKLAPSRWSHWGQSPWNAGPTDFPILQMVEAIQWNSLVPMYHPVLLRRLLNTELKVASPRDALTLPELFRALTDTLWSEVLTGPARPITVSRRAIQRGQLERLVVLVVRPQPGTPGDASALARAEMRRLQAAIRKALAPPAAGARSLDEYTRAHLEDADARITRALSAPLIAQ